MSKENSITQILQATQNEIKRCQPTWYIDPSGMTEVCTDFQKILQNFQEQKNNNPIEIVLTALYYLKQSLLLQSLGDSTALNLSAPANVNAITVKFISEIFQNPNISYWQIYQIYKILKIFADDCKNKEIKFSDSYAQFVFFSCDMSVQNYWLYKISEGLLATITRFKEFTNEHEVSIIVYFTGELLKLRKSSEWKDISFGLYEKLKKRPAWEKQDLKAMQPILKNLIEISYSSVDQEFIDTINFLRQEFNLYYSQVFGKYPAQKILNIREAETHSAKSFLDNINCLFTDLKIFPDVIILIFLEYLSGKLPNLNQNSVEPKNTTPKIDYLQEREISLSIAEEKDRFTPVINLLPHIFQTINNFPAFQILMSWFTPEIQSDIFECELNGRRLRTASTNPDVIDWIARNMPSSMIQFSHRNSSEIKKNFPQGIYNCLFKETCQNSQPLSKTKNLFLMLSTCNQRLILSAEEQKLIQSAKGNKLAFFQQQYNELISRLPRRQPSPFRR